MKLKKLLLSASTVAAGAGLFATVLTACGCSASDIDDDLKIDLQSDASLVAKFKELGFTDAVQQALLRTSGWTTFKTALAEEIVYRWYADRAGEKDTKNKNTSFRNFLDQAEYDINKDYDSIVDDLKSKYGANYKFYLQNQYLSPNGGTEETYKHAKMVEKVKNDFTNKVFTYNYFGYKVADPTGEEAKYPNYFAKVNTSPTPDQIKNPENWKNIGFYARVNPNFRPTDLQNTDMLAKYPDGDYATIQNYTFNRWFKTEKPFFSAAALFKYAAPKQAKSLDKIYNGTKTKLPDAPNESFPYFGGLADSTTTTGAKLFDKWFAALEEGQFQENGMYDTNKFNKTVSIPKTLTEDSQTLLLSFATQMIAGSENTLYTPYAVSAASLYNQMMANDDTSDLQNKTTQAAIKANLQAQTGSFFDDDTRILRNFLFKDNATHTAPTDIKSYIDLDTVYGHVGENAIGGDPYKKGEIAYHCPVFEENKIVDYFYGNDDKDETTGAFTNPGVRFACSNVQADLTIGTVGQQAVVQPWVLELNEAGMHAQTIDGYAYVKTSSGDKTLALKQVLMYRLLEQQCQFDNGMISASVFGSSSALSSYFNTNFTDIVLEMASNKDDVEMNVFRKVESFKPGSTVTDFKFFDNVINDQHFGVGIDVIDQYIQTTKKIDLAKKNYDNVVAANDKILAYRSTQAANAALSKEHSETVFNNGLLAPMPLGYTSNVADANYNSTHNYNVSRVVLSDFMTSASKQNEIKTLIASLTAEGSPIVPLFTAIKNAQVDKKDNGFSPLVSDAKAAMSNRYYYASAIIDKVMYSYMGSNHLANRIKGKTYKNYQDTAFEEGRTLGMILGTDNQSQNTAANAKATVYYASKLLTGDKNIASYLPYKPEQEGTVNFASLMKDSYASYLSKKANADGVDNDDTLAELLYDATITYLAKNNFENFYKALTTKIADNEKAFVGYLSKYNVDDPWITNPKGQTTDLAKTYGWDQNVGNLYDHEGYEGNPGASHDKSNRVNYDEYWNVINDGAAQLGGFLGLQTERTNALGVNEELQKAAFDNYAKCTVNSYKGYDRTPSAQDDGSLFAWANPTTDDCKEKYKFDPVEWTDDQGTKHTITESLFNELDILPAKKLAKQIAIASTLDDLREIAVALDSALMGKGTVFYKISTGDYPVDKEHPEESVKVGMLEELLKKDEATPTKYVHAGAFQRSIRVELHNSLGVRYNFETNADGYKLMMTQINKSDVTEKTLTPSYDATSHTWSMDGKSITMEEFWFIFCKMANETSNQQEAIADAVKKTFGDEKLIVYDAQLYNQFDSVWIKDWVKKPMGEDSK